MDYAKQQRDPGRHAIGIGFVILVHALVVWALLSGLGSRMIEVIKKPLQATIVEPVKPPPPPPPPPPKRIIEQPKVQAPEPYVPPPDVPVPQTTEAVIAAPTQVAPVEPRVIAPPAPAVVAPPAPPAPKPEIRRGISRIDGENPSYPKDAIRAGISKGRVVARLRIDEKGNVTEVDIIVSEPARVFDKVVRNTLIDWKFRPDGEKYIGEVEINFSIKE
jgi:protein TonB